MSARDGIGMTSERTRLRMIDNLRTQGIHNERVLGAMAEIPRHVFVDEGIASRAYEDVPLPIGHGQTISSPFIVAIMTELLSRTGDYGCPAGEAAVPGRPPRHARAVYLCSPAALPTVTRARAELGPLAGRVEIRDLPSGARLPGDK